MSFDVHPKTLTLGEPAVATFIISGIENPPPPRLPTLDGIRVEGNVGREKSTSVINRRIVTSTVTFRYRMLPTEEGVHTIAPEPYKVGAKTFEIAPVQIEVVPRPTEGTTSHSSLQDRLFATITTEKPSVFVQDTFDILLSVYSRNLAFGRGLKLQDLPTSGLQFQEFREIENTREIVNEKVYDVQRYRAQARGITAGTFQVQPTLIVPVRVQRAPIQSQSAFDRLFRSVSEQVEPVTVLPKMLSVEVLPLPEADRPESFSGAVGEFTFEVKAQPQRLQVGDPITLTMQIVGRGNMDAVSAPAIGLGPQFKVYDPRLVSKEMNDSRTYGRKVFEQVLIPKSDQIENIPSVRFSYFEPSTATYKILEQGPFHLEIAPTSNTVARVVQAAPVREEPIEVDILKNDIRYLKKAPESWAVRDAPTWKQPAMNGRLHVLPPLIALIVYLGTRYRRSLEQDVARSRRRRAPKKASSGIQRARDAAEEGNNQVFFEAVWDSLASYFGDRLNLAPGDVSAEEVATHFHEAGMEEDDCARIQQIFELCEQVRFSHGFVPGQKMSDSDQRNAEIILEKFDAVVKTCEKVRL